MPVSVRAILRPTAAAASGRLLATAAQVTRATSAPLAVAAEAHATPHEGLSSGELAWCEVYGVDYQALLKEAHDESPIALNAPPPRTPAEAEAAAKLQQQQDIWSVVFGTKQ